MARAAATLLLLALCGCAGASAPPATDEPRRYADYDVTTPGTDQCSLPVERRTGGWFCSGTE